MGTPTLHERDAVLNTVRRVLQGPRSGPELARAFMDAPTGEDMKRVLVNFDDRFKGIRGGYYDHGGYWFRLRGVRFALCVDYETERLRLSAWDACD